MTTTDPGGAVAAAARALVLLVGDAFHEALVAEGVAPDAIFRIMSAAGKGVAERMRNETLDNRDPFVIE